MNLGGGWDGISKLHVVGKLYEECISAPVILLYVMVPSEAVLIEYTASALMLERAVSKIP